MAFVAVHFSPVRVRRLPRARPMLSALVVSLALGGLVSAFGLWLLVDLHLIPDASGSLVANGGWPWPIDGPWALAADLTPMLLAAVAPMALFSFLMAGATGVRMRRGPLVALTGVTALVAATAGARLPAAAVLVLGLGAVFLAARRSALARRTPWSRRERLAVAAAGLALTAAPLGYGALHPLRAAGFAVSPSPLVVGDTPRRIAAAHLVNTGPLTPRVRGVALVGAHDGLEVTRVETDGGRGARGWFVPPAGAPVRRGTLGRGVYLTFACAAHTTARYRFDALDVRLRVGGVERTQRVALAAPLAVSCSG